MSLFEDLESASSASAEGGVATEFVGTVLSPAKKKQWKATIGTTPYGPSGHYNPHGLLAGQRYVAEKFACDMLKANDTVVIDVGAAPHRTFAHLGDRGRYIMPHFHPGDNTRLGRAPPESLQFICNHPFELCNCWGGDRSYLFTHSAYYIDPGKLWETLNEEEVKDCLVVEHVFDDLYGGFYEEATWSLERDVVTMRVIGNGHAYVHPLPPWQRGWIGENGEAFSFEVLKTLDSVTRVIRLEAVRSNRKSGESLTWMEVETNPDIAGPVQFSAAAKAAVADTARFTGVSFDVHKLYRVGPVLFSDFVIRGEMVSVTVPVNGVSQVAAHVCNRTRDAALYAEVTHVMRNRYARSRIPPAKAALVLSTVVALGFVVNLDHETNITYSMLDKFSSVMRVHSVLLQFGSITVRRWPWVLLVILLTCVWLVPLEMEDTRPWMRVSLAFVAVLFVILCVLLFKCATVVSKKLYEYRTKTWVDSLASDDSPTTPLLGQGHEIRRNLPIPGSRFIRPPPPRLQGELTLRASREKVSEPERTLVSGVMLDGAVPLVPATTQQGEVSAVTNRVLLPRDNPEPEALKYYESVFGTPIFTAVERGVDLSMEAFKRWTRKLAESYPVSYIVNLTEVWKQNQGAVAPPAETHGFLKVEKNASTVQVDGGKSIKTRLIQPPEDIDKAMTGYIVEQLYQSIRNAWDGVKCGVCYVSGRSLRYVGQRVDDYLAKYPDAVGWSVDMATYDATLGFELQEKCFDWYVWLGVPRWWISWLTRIRTRGITPNGARYKAYRYYKFQLEDEAKAAAKAWRKKGFAVKGPTVVADGKFCIQVEDFQMTSGRMDTNLTDTVALTGSIVGPLQEEKIEYLLLVCGDDGFLLLPPERASVVDKIVQLQKRLGFKPEGKVSNKRSDWEFCSKLFWFAREKGSDKDMTVLGSKPFRGIARMGINTTLPGAANAAASAMAVRVDSGHVPFLGAFADRTYELCRDKRVRPYGRVEWAAMRGDQRYDPSPLNWVITQERYNLGKENEDQFKLLLAGLHSVPIVLSYPPALDAARRDEE